MKCPSCGRDIDETRLPPGLAYCPYCGQELESASEDRARLSFCPYCGQKLTEPTNFCPHCGKKLVLDETKSARPNIVKVLKTLTEQIASIAKAMRKIFGRERKLRKLYEQWSEYAELPPEEIPSEDSLRHIKTEEKTEKHPSHDSENSESA